MDKLGTLTVSGKGLTDGDGIGTNRGAGSFGGRGGNGNSGNIHSYACCTHYISSVYLNQILFEELVRAVYVNFRTVFTLFVCMFAGGTGGNVYGDIYNTDLRFGSGGSGASTTVGTG